MPVKAVSKSIFQLGKWSRGLLGGIGVGASSMLFALLVVFSYVCTTTRDTSPFLSTLAGAKWCVDREIK